MASKIVIDEPNLHTFFSFLDQNIPDLFTNIEYEWCVLQPEGLSPLPEIFVHHW
jgi:hypothetical protein